MHSGAWRGCELASFLATGLLFWWPVVRSLRYPATSAGWGIVLYLLLATLPCDVLSAFLVFSDRVVYTVDLTNPRDAGLSALEPISQTETWPAVRFVDTPGERGPRASHANGASRRSGERESVWGSPRGEAPRMRLDDQQVAGALLGTVVTIVYLAAATALSMRVLSRQGRAWGPFVSNRVELS